MGFLAVKTAARMCADAQKAMPGPADNQSLIRQSCRITLQEQH